jgi:hypothetical protein
MGLRGSEKPKALPGSLSSTGMIDIILSESLERFK